MPTLDLWPFFMSSAVISLLLCVLFIPFAKKLKLMDRPAYRKVHSRPVALAGGMAIYLAMIIMFLLVPSFSIPTIPLLIACGLLVVTGMLDDRLDLNHILRFFIQIIACLIMIFYADVVLQDFGSLMWNGVLSLGWFAIPVTIFAALGVINAFNMIDGLDGLSSSLFIITSLAMALLAFQAGQIDNVQVLLIAAGATFGFLLLNGRFPWNGRARLFLGDSGSVFMGLFLVWQFIDLGNGDDRTFAPITAVWLFAIPLVDTIRLIQRRVQNGKSAFSADQFHLHHLFIKAGFTRTQTWVAISFMAAITSLVGLLGHWSETPEYLLFYGYIAFGLVYLLVIRRAWREGTFLGRRFKVEIV